MSTLAQAPGDPADRVVAFLNTLDVEDGVDDLESVTSYAAWSGRDQTPATLAEARRLRDLLRARAAGNRSVDPVTIGVDVVLDDQVSLRGATVTAEIAVAVAQLSLEGRLGRVKICPADDCRWAFYDHSRNQSRQWCSMQVCGNRAKVRQHRERASTDTRG
ncbi:CGNR zinc finger domain-containing protein [Mumia zhuanghuii]|uniref:CGNR zinc finger domain-containing protein n=1 Tax=Mumia zhuanghuii TaxID=2585211 RepID=A0A5C4MJ72_9ACTN|nr:CGNR zinc finger domain-containing protein [Mumia zhuanghuii]TNC42766.1 CGNR zinc finger domain-containing protein [Mumia zhuanghuii]TNC42796.1 CGNR zinc finger domain-containing protein [Mumia zhuanghuii]